jgi:hypothetical protein
MHPNRSLCISMMKEVRECSFFWGGGDMRKRLKTRRLQRNRLSGPILFPPFLCPSKRNQSTGRKNCNLESFREGNPASTWGLSQTHETESPARGPRTRTTARMFLKSDPSSAHANSANPTRSVSQA